MTLVAIGVDHRTAPVDLREALAFDGEQALRFLTEDAGALPERLLVSTCNRTELFAVTPPEAADRTEELARLLVAARGMDVDGLAGRSAVYREEEAVRHLFRVAAGIESMILGEPQILGQVKDAGELAADCGAAGPIMRRLVETAVRVGKRARHETAIGEGAVSVASAAVELAGMVFGDLSERSALVVGAGDTGALVARHLRGAGIGRLFVANRTLNRAVEVAGEVKGEPWGFCGIPPGLREADIVVTATSAEEPIVTYAELRAAMRVRKSRTLLILDIAMPRDVEPEAARIEGVLLHDVDALESIVDENLEVRRKAVPRVEAMVEEAVAGFLAWRRELEVVPTVKALRSRFEEIRQEELKKNLKRIPPEAREQAERLTESLLNRLLHEPTVRIREAGRGPDRGRGIVAAVRRIFGIGEREDD